MDVDHPLLPLSTTLPARDKARLLIVADDRSTPVKRVSPAEVARRAIQDRLDEYDLDDDRIRAVTAELLEETNVVDSEEYQTDLSRDVADTDTGAADD